MKKSSKFVVAGSLLLLAVVALALLARREHSSPAQAAPRPALTVSVERPRQLELPLTLAANGNIAAWQEAVVGNQAGGLRLIAVRVNVGDRVRAGDLLASFDAQTVQAEMAQTQASLREAEAQAAEAYANTARARTLQGSGALSDVQIAQYATAAATAAARVEAARAAVAAQRLRLKYTRVPAPDDGVISARSATVGAVVPAGAELFRMIRQGRLEWRAEVTASELGRLKPGMPVTVHLPGGADIAGKLRMLGPTVDLQSRTALVYVDLPTPDNPGQASPGAKAGMYASGEFQLGSAPALTVPQSAVVLRDGFSYVYRVDPDNRVRQLKVRTGRRHGTRVELVDGAAPDALLVVDGAGFLNDGDLVRRVDASAPAPAR